MTSTTSPKPTRRQLAFLRALAQRTGTTFSYPQTRRDASTQIGALVRRAPSEQVEFDLDRVAVRGGRLADEVD